MPVAAIVYVRDVAASLAFYEAVLAVPPQHIDDDGSYGELEHGETRVGFAAHWHAERNLAIPFRRGDPREPPGGFSLYFVVDDVDAAFARAIDAGARAVNPPEEKPWGRTAIARDPDDGLLVELIEA
jgi:predicted enzyme related to lactoylglutathione lyase